MTGDRPWIAVDWGTSNLRAWHMASDGTIIDHASSADGMGSLKKTEFEPALLSLVKNWLSRSTKTLVVACGMVGSRQGWVEAPYDRVPCTAMNTDRIVRADVIDPRLSVFVVPGISQTKPTEVMRGEETQVAGFLRSEPNFDGVVCLPGTHTKWCHVSTEEIVSFSTFMTGELFHLLSKVSVLRHSVEPGDRISDDFIQAVDQALSQPERVASSLFRLRANALLNGFPPERAASRLSGLLIGQELAAAKPYWLGRNVALIGNKSLSERYEAALEYCGLATVSRDATAMTLAGLQTAYSALVSEKTSL